MGSNIHTQQGAVTLLISNRVLKLTKSQANRGVIKAVEIVWIYILKKIYKYQINIMLTSKCIFDSKEVW